MAFGQAFTNLVERPVETLTNPLVVVPVGAGALAGYYYARKRKQGAVAPVLIGAALGFTLVAFAFRNYEG